jgi:CubicO group peptidase (beta-lactamase class C family)
MSTQMNNAAAESELTRRIHEFVDSRMAEARIPGLSLAVLRRGHPLILQGYGFANLEHCVPASAETLYEIASVSKQFVATTVILLAQEGKLTLDNPINTYFEDAPAIWQGITLRHLLTHTGGIVRDGPADYWNKPAAMHLDYGYAEMYAIIAGRDLDFAPGEKCSYSNSSYFLLGLIIEKLTRQTLNQTLHERIFAPLGMKATRINDPLAILPNRAAGYAPLEASDEGTKWRKTPYIGLRHHFANGGLVSTVADLAKWDAALMGETLLPQAALQEMWTPITLNGGMPTDRGLGWVVSEFEGHRQIHHGGLLPGFASNISRFVDDGLTVIVLTNSQFDWTANVPATLAKEIAKLCFE